MKVNIATQVMTWEEKVGDQIDPYDMGMMLTIGLILAIGLILEEMI